jgi:hypothetical protein
MLNNVLVKYLDWADGGGGIVVIGGGGATGGPSDPTTDPVTPSPAPDPPTGGGTGAGDNNIGGGNPADNNIVSQTLYSNMTVDYYKINLEATKTNIYGEALENFYYPSIRISCLVTRNPITFSESEFGTEANSTITVAIPRALLDQYGFLPEVGDILIDRERVFEVSGIDPTFVTIPGSANQSSKGDSAGFTIIYNLTCYLTRITKLNLIEYHQ